MVLSALISNCLDIISLKYLTSEKLLIALGAPASSDALKSLPPHIYLRVPNNHPLSAHLWPSTNSLFWFLMSKSGNRYQAVFGEMSHNDGMIGPPLYDGPGISLSTFLAMRSCHVPSFSPLSSSAKVKWTDHFFGSFCIFLYSFSCTYLSWSPSDWIPFPSKALQHKHYHVYQLN